MKNNITVIYNKSEIGAGTRGASLGIDALMMAALKKGNSFFSKTPSLTINDKNHILTTEPEHKWAKHIDALIPIYEEVCKNVSNVLQNNGFPVIISGDHASAGGTVAGIKNAYPDRRLGIIWIDAHADLRKEYEGSACNHACALYEANENTNCWTFDNDNAMAYGVWNDITDYELANESYVNTNYLSFDLGAFESDALSGISCSSGTLDDNVFDRAFNKLITKLFTPAFRIILPFLDPSILLRWIILPTSVRRP